MEEWETFNAIGVQLYASNEFDLALEAFKKAALTDSRQAIVFYNMGMTQRALGLEEEAQALLETYDRISQEACPYFRDHRRSGMEALPCDHIALDDFDGLLASGFRRTGNSLSRNICPDCGECVQLRIPLASFVARAGQSRIVRKNKDTRILISEHPEPNGEKAALMSRYMSRRHGWPELDYGSELRSYYLGWQKSFEMSYYYGGRLGMIAIFDAGRRDLYASACFFDPVHAPLSPGIFSLLSAIRWGAAQGFRYLYTGEYIEAKSNMRYKRLFRPHQILIPGRGWIEAEEQGAEKP